MEAGVPSRDTVTLYQVDGYTFTYAQYQAYLAQQEQIYNDTLAEYEAAVEEATQNALDEAEVFIVSIEAPVSRDINDYLSVADVAGSSPGDVDIPYEQDRASASPRYFGFFSGGIATKMSQVRRATRREARNSAPVKRIAVESPFPAQPGAAQKIKVLCLNGMSPILISQ